MATERRFRGVLSAHYDLIPLWLPTYAELQGAVAGEVAARYMAPAVIDLGVGTGATTSAIISRCPQARVTGVDDETAMLAVARRRLAAEITSDRVHLVEADALEWLSSVPDASIDVVASVLTLHNCADRHRQLLERETFRVLAPGGMFLNNDKYAPDDRGEYLARTTDAILSFDVLIDSGHRKLRRALIEHEFADQEPGRIMWAGAAMRRLAELGFTHTLLHDYVGQYALAVAVKGQ